MNKKAYCALKIAIIALFIIAASSIAVSMLMKVGGDTASLDLLRGQFIIFDIMTISIVTAIIIK